MKRNNSFTLLELIIAIVILGILAAIAAPMYTNAIEQRRGEVCINNMRMIFAAWEIYNSKNETDYASVTTGDNEFKELDNINATLRTLINEKYFGEIGPPDQCGFQMDYFPPPQNIYQLAARRLSGTMIGGNIQCYYYPNGHDAGGGVIIHYDWFGTWPWLPSDE